MRVSCSSIWGIGNDLGRNSGYWSYDELILCLSRERHWVTHGLFLLDKKDMEDGMFERIKLRHGVIVGTYISSWSRNSGFNRCIYVYGPMLL